MILRVDSGGQKDADEGGVFLCLPDFATALLSADKNLLAFYFWQEQFEKEKSTPKFCT